MSTTVASPRYVGRERFTIADAIALVAAAAVGFALAPIISSKLLR